MIISNVALKCFLLICKAYPSNIDHHFWKILTYSISAIDNQFKVDSFAAISTCLLKTSYSLIFLTIASYEWHIHIIVIKGQITSKGLFGTLGFFQKTNEQIRF